jgi:hypothetical protein
LACRLRGLSLPLVPGFHNAESEASFGGLTYRPETGTPVFTTLIGGAGCVFTKRPFSINGRLRSIAFHFKNGSGHISCQQDGGAYDLALGMEGQYAVTEINGVPFAANAFWRAPNKLEAIIRNLNTASGRRVIFTFKDKSLHMSSDPTPPIDNALADTNYREIKFVL